MLTGGANDLGGTLMEETIGRMAVAPARGGPSHSPPGPGVLINVSLVSSGVTQTRIDHGRCGAAGWPTPTAPIGSQPDPRRGAGGLGMFVTRRPGLRAYDLA
jgi:hypothetical protein